MAQDAFFILLAFATIRTMTAHEQSTWKLTERDGEPLQNGLVDEAALEEQITQDTLLTPDAAHPQPPERSATRIPFGRIPQTGCGRHGLNTFSNPVNN